MIKRFVIKEIALVRYENCSSPSGTRMSFAKRERDRYGTRAQTPIGGPQTELIASGETTIGLEFPKR